MNRLALSVRPLPAHQSFYFIQGTVHYCTNIYRGNITPLCILCVWGKGIMGCDVPLEYSSPIGGLSWRKKLVEVSTFSVLEYSELS